MINKIKNALDINNQELIQKGIKMIKIIRAPTLEELFKKVLQETGELLRMSFSRVKGEFRITVVFRDPQ